MSLHVYVAHTGARLEADPTGFESLDALRRWIATETSVPGPDQIILTDKGKHVKLPSLLVERELFLYDRALFATSGAPLEAPQSASPDIFEPEQPPDLLQNDRDIRAWESLFKARRDWALNVVRRCGDLADAADTYIFELGVIERCLLIATANHESHIRGLEQKHGDAKTWFDDLAKEQQENSNTWEADLLRLENIPARSQFLRFFTSSDKARENGRAKAEHLAAFVDREGTKLAIAKSKEILDSFARRLTNVRSAISRVSTQYQDLREGIAHNQGQHLSEIRDEPGKLMAEINAVARKIATDYDHIAALPAVPKSVTQASKLALLHTRNFLPNLKEYCAEMGDLARRAVELKNSAASGTVDRLQAVATIELAISNVNNQLNTLDVPQADLEVFEELSTVSRIPFVYGSLLVESVRRSEWIDRMKRDSSTLAEELATFQEEEQRRRRKWLKAMSDILRIEDMEGKAISVEINLLGEENGWPLVTRADVETYLAALSAAGGLEQIVENLRSALRDIDRPTRQQARRAKTFRAGSVHEAGFGRSSLMMRGEDETRALREANMRLEDELKGQRSRVRKLEGLLHGQSQLGRLGLGSGFAPQGGSPEAATPDIQGSSASPKLEDDLGRRASSSPRRLSTQDTQERTLTRKLVKLEAELLAEKAARADLEKASLSRQGDDEDVKRQIDEANSTKRDIMKNMEAQQREFARERRSLEEELKRAKQRIEDVEDELDRITGSRDNEKVAVGDRLQSLVAELDALRQDSADKARTSDEQIKSLQNEAQTREQADAERVTALTDLWSHLAPAEVAIPVGYAQLLSGIEDLARRSTEHAKDLEAAVALARSENDSLQASIEEQKTEASSLTDQITALEENAKKLREELMTERAKIASAETEKAEERRLLKEMQDKLAEGTTGSEALQLRVAEGENRTVRLSGQLAEAQSHANSLDVELSISEKKQQKLQSLLDANTDRLQQRSQRAKELTQRLYAQTDKLRRLLETLGFAVTHQDDTMIIQRASKANASAMLSEGSMSLHRSVSTPMPVRPMSDDLDLSVLHWVDKDDVEEEGKKYQEYIAALDKFDLKIFSDAVAKRMRDIEHTARKWQKETRGFRDKAHKLHSEAHDKIAFRNFKEGDLALFLPTRNQVTRPWAAFNVGAPHYFLREQDNHKLHNKEWLVARISKVEERVVDLSKTMSSPRINSDGRSIGETSEGGASFDDDNPFELSDGLRWYLLDAAEEKMTGAPATPGLGKATVASARVDARGSMRVEKSRSTNDASKNLSRSLDSRRSSTNSRKSMQGPSPVQVKGGDAEPSAGPSHLRTASNADSVVVENDTRDDARENGVGPTSASGTLQSPAHQYSAQASLNNMASPSKSPRSASTSPSKRGAQSGTEPRGLWDSLWKFDINLESSKGKGQRHG